MSKKCAACNSEIGLFTSKTEIANGCVCNSCLKKAGIENFENSHSFTCNSVRELIDRRVPFVKSFKATNKHVTYLQIDEVHKTFKVNGKVFEYSNLKDFQFIEDGEKLSFENIGKGLGAAAVGGLLLGGVGALAVGAVAGSKLLGGVCNSMEIRIVLRNTFVDEVVIRFIFESTRKKSDEYKVAKEAAQKCVATLSKIADYNNSKNQEQLDRDKLEINIQTNINTNTQTNTQTNTVFVEPARVNKKCMSCSALLVGKKGDVVCCKYCDTEQML